MQNYQFYNIMLQFISQIYILFIQGCKQYNYIQSKCLKGGDCSVVWYLSLVDQLLLQSEENFSRPRASARSEFCTKH